MDSRIAIAATLAGALVALWLPASGQEPGQAAPRVRVDYVLPEKFSDIGNRYSSGVRDSYLAELRRHIEQRAARFVPEGRNLVITLTEVDMAGNFEPLRAPAGDVRIVRDVYPPRIDLSFQLVGSDGTVMKTGERKLRNAAFMANTPLYSGDALRYEKVLLDDWLERELL